MLIPNENIVKNGKIVTASVKSIDFAKNSATLSCGTALPYDYCVIATGSMSKAPVEPPTGLAPHEYFNGVAAKIAHAKDIVVLGGGPVGIELAGEIKAKHPGTNVTLVSGTDTLCHNMGFPADTSAKIVDTLQSVGVKTLLGHPLDLGTHIHDSLVIHSPPKSYSDSLKNIDLVINCTGSVPNTKFLPLNLLTAKGLVRVNEFLQVKENVFAIGDCIDINESKNFVNVVGKDFMPGMPFGHSDSVAANLRALDSNQALTPYVTNKYVAGIIPCGPNASVTLGMPDEYGQYKRASYFYDSQFKFAKADKIPPMPAL